MYIFYQILLFIAYFGNIIHCYSEGVGLSGSSLQSSSGITCPSLDCRQRARVIAGSVVGAGIGIVLLIICIFICYKCCKGRPSKSNLTFINTTKHKNNRQEFYNINIVKSGFWSSRYLQNGIWHGPHRITLSFDSQSLKVTGSGSDDVGLFTIDGIFSIKTGRIGLTKTYQLSTGDRFENAGHQGIIQLTYNSDNRQFEGKWYVRMSKYRGEDKFELKFNKQQQQ